MDEVIKEMNVHRGAVCPNCGADGEQAWEVCQERGCANKEYHRIPEFYYDYIQEHPKKQDQMVGQVVGGRYLIVQKVGAGGMGSVFLALQRPFDQLVAIKVIQGTELSDQLLQRFEREARVLARVDHPNIVKLLDYGVETIGYNSQKTPFMALEYVKGGVTLDRFFGLLKKRRIEVSVQVLAHIFSQVMDALETAHSMKLIHRDIKPSNIMLKRVKGNPFMVKILDFGLAKAMGENSAASLTKDGIVGTPEYMAPEQAQKGKKADHRTDLYQVGVMLYEALCGVRPYEGSAIEVLIKKADLNEDPLQRPEAAVLPEPIKVFLRSALAPEPSQRFQAAAEFKQAMLDALFSEDFRIRGLVAPPITTLSVDSEFDNDFLELASASNITMTPVSGITGTRSGRRGGASRLGWAVGVALVIIMAGTVGWYTLGTKSGPSKKEKKTVIATSSPVPIHIVAMRIETREPYTGSRQDLAKVAVVPNQSQKKAGSTKLKKRRRKNRRRVKHVKAKSLNKNVRTEKDDKNGWSF